MELKVISADKYVVAAITNRGECEVEDYLTDEIDQATMAWRIRIAEMLTDISEMGLDTENIYSKSVNKSHKIYELKSGKIRLFYFKGSDELIIVCTSISRKTTQKANKAEVDSAIRFKKQFEIAVNNSNIKLIGI